MPSEMQRFYFPSSNQVDQICGARWQCESPLGILQIAHGMTEHIGRYDALAQSLCAHGWLVVGADLLGHGLSASKQDYGYFGEKDGWRFLISDVDRLRRDMQKEYPSLPYVLLGHSMGSFIARCYAMEQGHHLDGLVLSGTSGPKPEIVVGRGLARLFITTRGGRSHVKLLSDIAFGAYNRGFENRTTYDWLSRDHDQVDAYIAQDTCGFDFTTAGFHDLFTLIEKATSRTWAKSLPKDLPVHFISGDADPVGDHGRGVQQAYWDTKQAGLRDVSIRLYAGGRHEMFNETNREEVYQDLNDWLSSHIFEK